MEWVDEQRWQLCGRWERCCSSSSESYCKCHIIWGMCLGRRITERVMSGRRTSNFNLGFKINGYLRRRFVYLITTCNVPVRQNFPGPQSYIILYFHFPSKTLYSGPTVYTNILQLIFLDSIPLMSKIIWYWPVNHSCLDGVSFTVQVKLFAVG